MTIIVQPLTQENKKIQNISATPAKNGEKSLTENSIMVPENKVSENNEKEKESLIQIGLKGGLLLTSAIAGFAIFKNVKMAKQMKAISEELALKTRELNTTKLALKNAEKTLPAKQPPKSNIETATRKLQSTNNFLAELTNFLNNLKTLRANFKK